MGRSGSQRERLLVPQQTQRMACPVHQLLVKYNVTAFFHGHDHEYAHEQRDGIVYQLVPMAADATYGYGFNEYTVDSTYDCREPAQDDGVGRCPLSPRSSVKAGRAAPLGSVWRDRVLILENAYYSVR